MRKLSKINDKYEGRAITRDILIEASLDIKQLKKKEKKLISFMDKLVLYLLEGFQEIESSLGVESEGCIVFSKYFEQKYKIIYKHYSMDESSKWHEIILTVELLEGEFLSEMEMKPKSEGSIEITQEVLEYLESIIQKEEKE